MLSQACQVEMLVDATNKRIICPQGQTNATTNAIDITNERRNDDWITKSKNYEMRNKNYAGWNEKRTGSN